MSKTYRGWYEDHRSGVSVHDGVELYALPPVQDTTPPMVSPFCWGCGPGLSVGQQCLAASLLACAGAECNIEKFRDIFVGGVLPHDENGDPAAFEITDEDIRKAAAEIGA